MNERYRGKHVRVFALDRHAILTRVRAAAARLAAEHDEVLEVRLFGSLVRGNAAPGSDADLLIIVRENARRFLDRADPFAQYFDGIGIGYDLLVYTEPEVAHLAASPSLVQTALREGELIAHR